LIGLFASLFLVSGSASLVLFLAFGATLVIYRFFPLQEFVFSEGIGFFAIGLAAASLSLDLVTFSWRRAQVFTHCRTAVDLYPFQLVPLVS
jgi:hypothetical protein